MKWIGAVGTAALMLLLAYAASNVLVSAWGTSLLTGGALALNAIVVLALDVVAIIVALRLIAWAARS